MALFVTLFVAGVLTILLPCILPLIPIVLGVSIAGRSRLRPLLTVLGMVVSFVGFTFLLLVTLREFVEVADYLRIGTYYVLLLFGLGFVTDRRLWRDIGAAIGSLFFLGKGMPSVLIALLLGIAAMHAGSWVASRLQQFGSDVQGKAREEFGQDAPLTAFIIGLTMGLVWVPCAGPALGFVFALIREQPDIRAIVFLLAYALGTAIPLLLIGYGGQAAVRSVRVLSRYSGFVKQVAGVLLVLTAIAFQLRFFENLQVFLAEKTSFGNLGTRLEEKFFGQNVGGEERVSSDFMKLPKIVRAPEFSGLGPWHNAEPFTLASLEGKVVLVDFWTYSCINCIRTLPYIQGYWEKYENAPFVLIGVHTPEFVFEKSEENVADAIRRHGLTYPIAQDNDFGTWRAFSNRYWPAKYLIDAEGYIRYTHFGEGAYEETDRAIASLLNEIGIQMSDQQLAASDQRSRGGPVTPETYLGSRSWPSLGNGRPLPTDEVTTYEAPSVLKLHKYYLVGEWQLIEDERQVLRSDEGEIRMKFLGGEINLVLGMEKGSEPAMVDVEVDGEHHTSFVVDRQDLFPLFAGEYGEHEIVLRIRGKGLEGYAFTFGS